MRGQTISIGDRKFIEQMDATNSCGVLVRGVVTDTSGDHAMIVCLVRDRQRVATDDQKSSRPTSPGRHSIKAIKRSSYEADPGVITRCFGLVRGETPGYYHLVRGETRGHRI